MSLRSFQRDLDVNIVQAAAAVLRRAACTHAVDAHVRYVRTVNDSPADDHATEIVYCNDCDRYLLATSWRTRPEVDYAPLSDAQTRTERKREQDDLAARLHRPGSMFR